MVTLTNKSGGIVCVCVCEREKERERETDGQITLVRLIKVGWGRGNKSLSRLTDKNVN
jgi:hypothetical protein